jgi:hypothetical protein
MLDRIKMARSTLNIGLIAENLADMVMEDLLEAGYECKLIKQKPKKPKTWRIVPKASLSDEEQFEFDSLKEERTNIYVEMEKERLKEMYK